MLRKEEKKNRACCTAGCTAKQAELIGADMKRRREVQEKPPAGSNGGRFLVVIILKFRLLNIWMHKLN